MTSVTGGASGSDPSTENRGCEGGPRLRVKFSTVFCPERRILRIIRLERRKDVDGSRAKLICFSGLKTSEFLL
jgi:hypothetical protein